MQTQTFVYDDPEHPDRPTSAISSPLWTPEDRGLLEALDAYEKSLCDCGWDRTIAWHSDMEGWFEADKVVCHACSAAHGREVAHNLVPTTDRDFEKKPLIPFVMGETTTPPTEKPTET